ncbi:hypothetical protein L7F22_033951 [Adiantum nelumboides]|nr:hypothetical protein [Adiantum nelumboides]
METGFKCSSPVVPGDVARSIDETMKHGIQQAARELGLSKKHLAARPIGPLMKDDGSPFPVEEWVNKYFVVVEASSDAAGLLGRAKAERDLTSQLLKEGVEDLHPFPPKASEVTSETSEEIAALRAKIILLEEENVKLKAGSQNLLQVATLQQTVAILQQTIGTILADNTSLRAQVSDQDRKISDLQGILSALQEENTKLMNMMIAQQEKNNSLSGMELIMMRKLLDQCRDKCKTILSSHSVDVAKDWNEVVEDPMCVTLLNQAGLTIGLPSTKYGRNTQQAAGSRAAHEVTEPLQEYATIVCKMMGAARDRMLDVFRFTFGVDAEGLAFVDTF